MRLRRRVRVETAAFAIPIVQKLQERKESQWRESGLGCLVMVPTRELALQLTEVFTALAERTGVTVLGLTGGVEIEPQIAQLTKELDILITTPAVCTTCWAARCYGWNGLTHWYLTKPT